MHALAGLLRRRREERGALDFNIEQAQVILDQDDPRRVRDVRRSKTSAEIKIAYGIVEDTLVIAPSIDPLKMIVDRSKDGKGSSITSNPDWKAKMKGYTDLWDAGGREIMRVV